MLKGGPVGVVGRVAAVSALYWARHSYLPRFSDKTRRKLILPSTIIRNHGGRHPLSTTDRWDDNLEGAARDFAATDHSPVRAIAGPGTGKTYALMRRVMRLLQHGTDPAGMLVCTFTRTAANDLKGELGRLGVEGSESVRTGTLHAFCLSLLRRADVPALTGRVARMMLSFEERIMLEDLKSTGEGFHALNRRLQAFAAAWARHQSNTPGSAHDADDRTFLACLCSWLRFHDAMLIGELVPEALRFLQENPESTDRPRLEHVLVDEYQDLNKAEQVLLDELAQGATLTVIGDEDQSIYTKLRHAHPDGIADFDQTHDGTHDETFDQCRRCPRIVIEMANALIKHNTARTPRQLVPMDGSRDGEVHVVQWLSPREEAEGLAQFIADRMNADNVEASNVLVLATRRRFGYAIRDALRNRDVSAISFFTEQALEGNPLKANSYGAEEAFTLLTLLADTDDRVSLRTWCGFGNRSACSSAWKTLRDHCQETGKSPRQALEELAQGSLQLPRMGKLVEAYRTLTARLAAVEGLKGAALVAALFPEDQGWAKPLRALASLAEDDGPAELHQGLLRAITQPELPTDVDYVRVMSLHKSKGLTADLVVVAGCIEGLLPTLPNDAPPTDRQRELEEQRRLLYVAINRARETLVLSSVSTLETADLHRMGGLVAPRGRQSKAIASSFLNELGPSRPGTKPGASLAAGGVRCPRL